MTSRKSSRINQVLQNWPKHTVAVQSWLSEFGVSTKLAQWYVESEWLVRFGSGAYVRPGDEVQWHGGLYTLQTQMDMTVHVGGLTALQLQGLSHYLPLNTEAEITLISDVSERLPAWFEKHNWKAELKHRNISLFETVPEKSVQDHSFGSFSIGISSKERALMEYIRLAGSNEEYHRVYLLMENLTTARPGLVQMLLENCLSVKVKRLFLWSAEKAGHSWFEHLNPELIDLGKGKRQLFVGGVYDSKYGITVPGVEETRNV